MRDIVETSSGPPHTFGWIRRPDLDMPMGKAWERPDGKIYLFPKDAPDPTFVRLKSRIRYADE